jgi:Tubulin-tyrosine ligase family
MTQTYRYQNKNARIGRWKVSLAAILAVAIVMVLFVTNNLQMSNATVNDHLHYFTNASQYYLFSLPQVPLEAPPIMEYRALGGDSTGVSVRNATSPGLRRIKAHFCQEPYCGTSGGRKKRRVGSNLCRSIGQRILEDEFGFQSVDARHDLSWELIFGGYVYCGVAGVRDVKMKLGLNRQLNERGWDTLSPNQVWFPCMGCQESYCSKLELCRFLQSIDPNMCFILPQDSERWQHVMNDTRPYVLKGTSPYSHGGANIRYIQTKEEANRFIIEVNSSMQNQSMTYIAQPYNEPLLGTGEYRRKGELQIYLALTSSSPLRLYYYEEHFVVLAAAKYTDSSDAMRRNCMLDAHMTRACKRQTKMNRRISYQEYSDAVGLTTSERAALIDKAIALLSSIFHAAQPAFATHHINRGITKSGASCFSYMRADFGITEDKLPFLFEINELPDKTGTSYNRSDASFRIREDSLRDLFVMIGLDRPPLSVDERAEYEATHLGGWKPIF